MFDIEEPAYFTCECYSDEHTLRFSYIRDPEFHEVYTSIYVGNPAVGFLGRLWSFVKYVFGHRCRYGDFDCFCLNPKDLDKLIALLQSYKKDIEGGEKLEELE
jgi:hypothetical protein